MESTNKNLKSFKAIKPHSSLIRKLLMCVM